MRQPPVNVGNRFARSLVPALRAEGNGLVEISNGQCIRTLLVQGQTPVIVGRPILRFEDQGAVAVEDSCVGIAQHIRPDLGNVRGLARRRLDAACEEIIVQDIDSGSPRIRVWGENFSTGFFPVEKECTLYDEFDSLYSCPIDFGDLYTELI